jgi:hypothetical protein
MNLFSILIMQVFILAIIEFDSPTEGIFCIVSFMLVDVAFGLHGRFKIKQKDELKN